MAPYSSGGGFRAKMIFSADDGFQRRCEGFLADEELFALTEWLATRPDGQDHTLRRFILRLQNRLQNRFATKSACRYARRYE